METNRHAQQPPQSSVLFTELIFEILTWLPVVSLLRFRCVSKSWKSLISNPQFIKSHMVKSPKSANLILTFDDYPFGHNGKIAYCISSPKPSLLENASSIVVQKEGCYQLKTYWPVGTCNGLVCLEKSQFTNGIFTQWFRFWNPATRLRSKKSPSLDINSSNGSWIGTGFGYDNLSETFKVVSLILISQKIIIKVLTMGDNFWREILSFPSFPFLHQYKGQFVSGTLNWLALCKSSSGLESGTVTINQLMIFSFDLEKETYNQLMLPVGFDEVPSDEPNLGVVRDSLCLFHCHRGTHLVIWQMKEFGVEKSWTQLMNVSYEHLQIDIEAYHLTPLPLCTTENGYAVVVANINDCEIVIYNWKDNRVDAIEILHDIIWMDAMEYVQSLILPC